jgi:Mce-associated membrane protein
MEGDAGTSQLNPTDSDTEEVIDQETTDPRVVHGRLSGRAAAAVVAVLVVLAGALAVVGYLLLQWNARSEQIQRDGAVALQAAKDCVIATQAPDTASMGAAQARIIECSTGDFGAQAVFYSSMLTEAYQAANVQVEVADLRAAVEGYRDDGAVDVLVALRTKVTNTEAAGQEQGYRLRVTMQRDNGTYKIANMVQVTT